MNWLSFRIGAFTPIHSTAEGARVQRKQLLLDKIHNKYRMVSGKYEHKKIYIYSSKGGGNGKCPTEMSGKFHAEMCKIRLTDGICTLRTRPISFSSRFFATVELNSK